MFLLPSERWITLLMVLLLVSLLALQITGRRRQNPTLLIHSSDGWEIQYHQPAHSFSGALVQAGYRSAWLIILVIQSRDNALHRVVVWHDQVSSRQFSYLHQQLAFAAETPARRRPGAWLHALISVQPEKTSRPDDQELGKLHKQTRSQSENALD